MWSAQRAAAARKRNSAPPLSSASLARRARRHAGSFVGARPACVCVRRSAWTAHRHSAPILATLVRTNSLMNSFCFVLPGAARARRGAPARAPCKTVSLERPRRQHRMHVAPSISPGPTPSRQTEHRTGRRRPRRRRRRRRPRRRRRRPNRRPRPPPARQPSAASVGGEGARTSHAVGPPTPQQGGKQAAQPGRHAGQREVQGRAHLGLRAPRVFPEVSLQRLPPHV